MSKARIKSLERKLGLTWGRDVSEDELPEDLIEASW